MGLAFWSHPSRMTCRGVEYQNPNHTPQMDDEAKQVPARTNLKLYTPIPKPRSPIPAPQTDDKTEPNSQKTVTKPLRGQNPNPQTLNR